MAGRKTSLELPFDLPDLPLGWSYRPLGALVGARGISYGIVQPGKHQLDGVPIIRVNNIKNGHISGDDVLRVSTEIEASYERTRLRGGEVLLTLVGSLGEAGIVPPQFAGWNVARAVGVIPVESDPGSRWVALCLRSQLAQRYIHMWATTTVQATFNLRDVARLPIPIPPKREREAIAHILGTLDDKIELNRRMNETLEAMARAIFKSWFVDFDPVRAKAEGRDPGLPKSIADLFPDSFQDSDLGKIPIGWRPTCLCDVVDVFDSKRIPLSGRERAKRQGMYPYYGAAGALDHVNDYLFDDIYVLLGEDGSVVNDDGTPVVQYVWGKFWVNNHAHVLQGKNGVCSEHVMLHLRQCNITPFVTGAVQPKLNQGNMNQIEFLLPSASICDCFRGIISPLYAQYRAYVEESHTLAALRNTLLPRLLSGELQVKEAMKSVETCV